MLLFEMISLGISLKELFLVADNGTYEDCFLGNICALVFLFPSILQAIFCFYFNGFNPYVFLDFNMPFHAKFDLLAILFIASLLYLFFTIRLARNCESILFPNRKGKLGRKALLVLAPILWPFLLFILYGYCIARNWEKWSMVAKYVVLIVSIMVFPVDVISYYHASGIMIYMVILLQYIIFAYVLKKSSKPHLKKTDMHIPIQLQISIFVNILLLVLGNVRLCDGYYTWKTIQKKYQDLYPTLNACAPEWNGNMAADQGISDDYIMIHTMLQSIDNNDEGEEYRKILTSCLSFFHNQKRHIGYGTTDGMKLDGKMLSMILGDAKHIFYIYDNSNIAPVIIQESIFVLKAMQNFIYSSCVFDPFSIRYVLMLEEFMQKMQTNRNDEESCIFSEIGNLYWVDILLRSRMWEFCFLYETTMPSINASIGLDYDYNNMRYELSHSSILCRCFPFFSYFCASACYSAETKRNVKVFSLILENNDFGGFSSNCIALMHLNDEISISPLLVRLEHQIQALQDKKFVFSWNQQISFDEEQW